MAAFTYPGVYIEELSSGQHTITGVATSIGAFIGWAKMGPVDQATLVQSWSDFQTTFGGLDSRSWLGYAVNQFFGNGGNECYIVRLAWDGKLQGGLNNPVACATAVANGVGYGAASVTATYEGASASISLGIGTPALESIAVLPANLVLTPTTIPTTLSVPPLPVGATLTLQAYGVNSDGSGGPPTGTIDWVSSNPSIATVAGGIVKAVGVAPPGTTGGSSATITATSDSITGSFVVSVTSATLKSITISPAAVTTNAGETVQLAAAANYSDNTSPDITSIAVWASATPAAVTFGSSTAVPLSAGEFLAVAKGSSNVTAALASAWSIATTSAPLAVTVNAPEITSAGIVPGDATVPLNAGALLPAFTVAPVYSAATGGVAGTASDWTSSDETVATIDSGGKVTLVNAGITTITALYTPTAGTGNPMNLTTTLTVKSADLESISVTPQTISLAAGLTQQLTATAVFNDGTSVDITSVADWTPLAAGDVTVSSSGLVTALKATAAPVDVQAEFLSDKSTSAVTVTAAVVESLAITTASGGTSITPGQNFALIATASYSDGSTPQVVTNSATWSTSTPLLVTTPNQGIVSSLVAGGSLTLFASSPGLWGNTLQVSISVPANSPGRFGLQVLQVGTSGQTTTLESYVNLSVLPSDPSYVVTLINNDSNYITFMNPQTLANVVPMATPVATASPVSFTGGADGTVLVPNDGNFELALAESETAGYQLLDRVDIFNLLCIPGESTPSTISNLQAYCAAKRAFYIVDSPQNATISNLITSGPVGSSPGSITGSNANYSAFYFPWVQAPDPLVGNRPALFPPSGFVAGIYAATDASRGVWKAPAGIAASLTGNSGLQYVITEAENGSLNPQAVNCIRQFKVYGDVVWGARTLDGNDQQGSQWKYVPIRRLALYIESSLYDGTQWVVFEPNDETLWGQVRLNVGTFMQGLFLQGAFAGTTPQQAYFVKCDGENNPAASVAQGIVNILVGFAPVYPAEFVLIEIQQIVANS
jgi:phage tail sheath protein FI